MEQHSQQVNWAVKEKLKKCQLEVLRRNQQTNGNGIWILAWVVRFMASCFLIYTVVLRLAGMHYLPSF